jgi:hypothetical protein
MNFGSSLRSSLIVVGQACVVEGLAYVVQQPGRAVGQAVTSSVTQQVKLQTDVSLLCFQTPRYHVAHVRCHGHMHTQSSLPPKQHSLSHPACLTVPYTSRCALIKCALAIASALVLTICLNNHRPASLDLVHVHINTPDHVASVVAH